MKFLALAGFALMGIGGSLQAATICPVTTNTNTDCAFILTIGSGGAITGAAVPGANPYDGSEDALVGVVNNSGKAFTGSIALSSGADIFGFDGDGICTFSTGPGDTNKLSYCIGNQRNGSDPQDYQGPINTFTITNAFSGLVNITNLAAGATTFFSLEGSPSSIGGGGGITVGGNTPEPATFAMIGGGLVALAFVRKRASR